MLSFLNMCALMVFMGCAVDHSDGELARITRPETVPVVSMITVVDDTGAVSLSDIPVEQPTTPSVVNDTGVVLSADADGDGYVDWYDGGEDCDDSNATIYPGAPELCNGQDDNCDTVIDYIESDIDGDGQSICAGDCDDANPNVSSAQIELCNGRDDNCDLVVPADENDLDGDGERICAGDCDDTDADVTQFNERELRYEGLWVMQDELCRDGIDNDCDGFFDLADWDCGNDDGDFSPVDVDSNGLFDDPIVNGVDVMNLVDTDGDGLADTLCSLASECVSGAWEDYGALYLGDLTGDLTVLDPSPGYRVSLDDQDGDGVGESWCFSWVAQAAFTGSMIFVSSQSHEDVTVPVDLNNSLYWYKAGWGEFCEAYQDTACYRDSFGATRAGTSWDGLTLSPAGN